MKSFLFKINLSLLLVLAASFSFSQRTEDIKFEKLVQKFEKTDEGKIVTLDYHFKYSGQFKLSIIPPETDCTCTEIELPKEVIAPNSSHTIKIKFNTKDKIGFQQRKVTIQFVSDNMDSRSINKTLVFKGVVKASEATKERYRQNKKKK